MPFVHTAIESNGDVLGCCLTPPFRTATGEAFNLNVHTLNEVYESDDFKGFIQAFEEDRRHPYCHQCWEHDDAGIVSNRHKFSEWLLSNLALQENPTARDMAFLEIKVGNKCNLKCRICGPHNSSKAAQEEAALGNEKALASVRQSAWINMDAVWDQLAERKLKAIHIMGGEPFLDRTHLKLLEKLIVSGRSQDIALWYNSNGTIFPDDFFDIWRKFKKVEISLSIDDVGPRYEYQRFPAKWDQVRENILKLVALNAEGWIHSQLDICWSTLNMFYFDEIITTFEDLFTAHGLSFGTGVAGGRHFYVGIEYTTKALRPEHQKIFLNRLMQSQYLHSPKYRQLTLHLINQLDKGFYDPKGEKSRIHKLRRQDEYRKQSFAATFPEIAFMADEIGLEESKL